MRIKSLGNRLFFGNFFLLPFKISVYLDKLLVFSHWSAVHQMFEIADLRQKESLYTLGLQYEVKQGAI